MNILLKQNPSMSAKDVIKESLEHKGELDVDRPKPGAGASGEVKPGAGASRKESKLDKAKRLGL